MTPVNPGNNPDIPEFLQYVYEIWIEYPYVYRLQGRLVGVADISPEVVRQGGTLNITHLMELAVNGLSQGAVRQLSGKIAQQQVEATFGLRSCLSGRLPVDSQSAHDAARRAVLKLNLECEVPLWSGDDLDDLCEWMIKWLLRPQATRLLRQSPHEGLGAAGLFHQRRKALEAVRTSGLAAA